MGIAAEFKAFIARGNVIDLAVGVIIGGAFGKITTSLVEDVIMPPISLLLGRVDVSNLYIPLDESVIRAAAAAPGPFGLAEAKKAGPVLAYGNFMNTVVQFLILALVIFMFVKFMNRLHGSPAMEPEPAAPPEPTNEEKLLGEIRDLLRK
jgi:large conductance mechanosensitive channel